MAPIIVGHKSHTVELGKIKSGKRKLKKLSSKIAITAGSLKGRKNSTTIKAKNA